MYDTLLAFDNIVDGDIFGNETDSFSYIFNSFHFEFFNIGHDRTRQFFRCSHDFFSGFCQVGFTFHFFGKSISISDRLSVFKVKTTNECENRDLWWSFLCRQMYPKCLVVEIVLFHKAD